MAQGTPLPIKNERAAASPAAAWHPFTTLRREMERLLDDFDGGLLGSPFRRSSFDLEPFWQREMSAHGTPAVDIAETDQAYELTADLPGMDEKAVEVKLSNGNLIIRGEKQAEKEEKKKDYYLHERTYGSFERRFRMPEGVDADKIAATFDKGVLKVTLPKTHAAQKAEKSIAVKSA